MGGMSEWMWILLLLVVLVSGAAVAREPFMLIVAPLPIAAVWVVATLLAILGYLAICVGLREESRHRGKAGMRRGFKRSTPTSYARPIRPMTVRGFVNPVDI